LQIKIKAFPGSSKNEITGVRDSRLCVRVAAAPQDGKANSELCGFLAKTFGCSKREVKIISGEKSKTKTVSLPSSYIEKLKEIIKASV